MDEAERCHEIAYIADGRLLVSGTIAEIIARGRPLDLYRHRPGSRRAGGAAERDAGRRHGRALRHGAACRRPRRGAARRDRPRFRQRPRACTGRKGAADAGGRVHRSDDRRPAGRRNERTPKEKPRLRVGFAASLQRLDAMFVKEFIQLRRDRGDVRDDRRHSADAADCCSASPSTPIPSICRPRCSSRTTGRWRAASSARCARPIISTSYARRARRRRRRPADPLQRGAIRHRDSRRTSTIGWCAARSRRC